MTISESSQLIEEMIREDDNCTIRDYLDLRKELTLIKNSQPKLHVNTKETLHGISKKDKRHTFIESITNPFLHRTAYRGR